MTPPEHERALAGAAILDLAIARLLLTELDERDFGDPTARLVLQVLREGLRAEELLEADPTWDRDEPPPSGWVEPTDLEIVVEMLDCSGRLEMAGGAEAVAALIEDRPALREALVAGRRVIEAIGPVEEEAMVELAARLLG